MRRPVPRLLKKQERDPATGRIVTSVVLGRKYCTRCGRWKHLLYFRPKPRSGGGVYASSDCDTCHNIEVCQSRRDATGQRRAQRQEYERIYYERERRRQGIPPRFEALPVSIPTAPLVAYLERFIVLHEPGSAGGSATKYLNGRPLSDSDARLLNRWDGDQETADFDTVDSICARYDLALWELEEEVSEWNRSRASHAA